MTASFWNSVLAAKTFNSGPGRTLQAEAKKKLAALPEDLPQELLEKVLLFYLEEADYDLWAAAAKMRDAHAPTVAKVLRGPKAKIQARFIVAGFDQGGADGLRLAGSFFALIGKNSHVPGMNKSLAKAAAEKKLDVKGLAPMAAKALSGQTKKDIDIMPFYGALWLVARGLPKDPSLEYAKKFIEPELYERTIQAAKP
jgi:hypothetical protein